MSFKVYVGNLGPYGDKDELFREFSKFGSIANVWVARNPPGFAFVHFNNQTDAEDAVRYMDGKRICGVRLKVELATTKTEGRDDDSPTERSRTPRRFTTRTAARMPSPRGRFSPRAPRFSPPSRGSPVRGRPSPPRARRSPPRASRMSPPRGVHISAGFRRDGRSPPRVPRSPAPYERLGRMAAYETSPDYDRGRTQFFSRSGDRGRSPLRRDPPISSVGYGVRDRSPYSGNAEYASRKRSPPYDRSSGVPSHVPVKRPRSPVSSSYRVMPDSGDSHYAVRRGRSPVGRR